MKVLVLKKKKEILNILWFITSTVSSLFSAYLRSREWNLTNIDLVKTVSSEETDLSSTWARSSTSTWTPARLVSTAEHRSNILSCTNKIRKNKYICNKTKLYLYDMKQRFLCIYKMKQNDKWTFLNIFIFRRIEMVNCDLNGKIIKVKIKSLHKTSTYRKE